ncbi:MAG: hypothetical protein JSW16_01960 [Dehalococcoidales bacterium]|nr:MAG: hypothetical protein JSW16_01960 [Dehalococcoidales bacterium]
MFNREYTAWDTRLITLKGPVEFPADPDFQTVSQPNEVQQMSYQDQFMTMAIKMLDAMEMARSVRYLLRF